MKANELMIGDWVWYDNQPYQIRQLGIFGEDRDGEDYPAVCVGKPSGIGLIIERNEIEPIPLTPEILEKNGFHINGIPNSITSVKAIDDWSDDTYVWSRQETPDERMFVSVYMDDPANFFVEVYCQYCHVDGIHVKYLHELQHALKLCGIGIEIRL